MLEEKIVINKSDLEELIAKEVAKKLTAKQSRTIFADLNVIDKNIEELNRSKQEVVEYARSQQRLAPANWVNLSNLVERRSYHGDGFYMTKPTLYNDPHNLIRKLVILMFGSKHESSLDSRDIDKARKLYSEISSIFLTAYGEHLNDVVDGRHEVSQ